MELIINGIMGEVWVKNIIIKIKKKIKIVKMNKM